MRLHIVGGFLGSGKTTAIAKAAKILAARGLKVGVVTNDQGKTLVDSLFMDFSGAPKTEITGGCFCCRYEDFSDRLAAFAGENRPDWIFAEAVGSCADVVATVVMPIAQAMRGASLAALGFSGEPTFSVFCDSRLLLRRLTGAPLPFSEDLVYLFDKQIEEAGLLVVNKLDLISEPEVLKAAAGRLRGDRPLRFQSARQEGSIEEWLQILEKSGAELSGRPEMVDYERYGRAEAGLAWGDAELSVIPEPAPEVKLEPESGPDTGAAFAAFFVHLVQRIEAEAGHTGHAKAFVGDAKAGGKISIVSAGADEDLKTALPPLVGSMPVLLNLRIECSPQALETVLYDCIARSREEFGIIITIRSMQIFSPSPPSVPAQSINAAG